MNRRTIVMIALGVLLAHLAVFWLLSDKRVLPKKKHVPRPNFIYREKVIVDEETGEKTIHREITVSTKLRDLGPRSTSTALPMPDMTP